ncbi:MAG: MarR family transcriptional regulator [Gemmatimonadaceae bacterium]
MLKKSEIVPGNAPLHEAIVALEAMLREMRLCDEISVKLFGVTAAQLRLLCELAVTDEQSVTMLSAALNSNQSTVSELLTALTRKGLTLKRPVATDDRAVAVKLSGRGRKIALKAQGVGRPLLMGALSEMPVSGVATLVASVRRLTNEMEAQRDRLARP